MWFLLSRVLQCTCGLVHDLYCTIVLLVKFTPFLFVAFLMLISAIYLVNNDY